jgi:hypothetical protein
VAFLDVHLKEGLVTPVVEALRSLHVPFALASAYGATDLASIEALADAPMVGKITSDRDLIAALDMLSMGGLLTPG